MSKRDLLIEIGTEELPPTALLTLSKAFCREVEAGLKSQSLLFESIEPFATPRRLAMIVRQLDECQPDQLIEKFGPAVKAAFDDQGNPTKAAEGFARSCSVAVESLEQKDDGKVTKLYFQASKAGAETQSLIADIVSSALSKLPVPKRMRWGNGREEFVRPVHWAILLFGEEVVPATILGVKTANLSYGHRFHHPDAISLNSASDYEAALEKGHVVASYQKRMDSIRTLLETEASKLKANVVIDDELLKEVAALVEWPVALTGNFNPEYLSVPQEALVSSMKEHQKYFHLLDNNNDILPHFIAISNLQSNDPSQVIAGNEKVIGPRLADAAFFFNQDKKQTLESRREKLKTVVFQHDLGTLFEKSERVKTLASNIAQEIQADSSLVERAAELGKCDLLTNMVYEFTDLQGIMGRYYAEADNEPTEVALALNEQYLPRFSGDILPESKTGIVLALAERLDTICGLFSIGQPPTGSKDPFALRRAALGILRILIEKQLDLDLPKFVRAALQVLPNSSNSEISQQVLDFIFDRLRALYNDTGINTDTFLAVDAVRPASPFDFDLRVKAVSQFQNLPQSEALAAANKRVANILSKLESLPSKPVNPQLLTEPAEKELAEQLIQHQDGINSACKNKQYTEALSSLAGLQKAVDSFFDQVMVNTEDQATRENRQALLLQLRTLFLRIADISSLQAS